MKVQCCFELHGVSIVVSYQGKSEWRAESPRCGYAWRVFCPLRSTPTELREQCDRQLPLKQALQLRNQREAQG